MLFKGIFWLFFISVLPLVELRLAIPVGILTTSFNLPFGFVFAGFGLNFILVFLICVIADILLGLFLFKFLNLFDRYFDHYKPYKKFMDRSHRKVKPYVDKWGVLGIAFFIAIPVPGSGVYVGTLGASVLGFTNKQYIKGLVIGVISAATIVTTLVMLGVAIFA